MATFTGTGGADVLNAATGTIVGFTGGTLAELQDSIGDMIQGGPGQDNIVAGVGNDTFIAGDGHGADNIDGGGGNDILNLFNITVGGAVVNLSAGTWDLSPTSGAAGTIAGIETVIGSRNGDTISGSNNNETLYGARGNDVLNGSGGADIIDGGGGSDIISGGVNADTIFGNVGADTIIVNDNDFIDKIDGGKQFDTLDLSAVVSRGAVIDLIAGTWDLTPSFGGPASIISVERIKGTQLGDSVTGTAISDRLDGNGGNDTLNGGAGIDEITGGNGNDSIDGGSGSDILQGGANNDTINGGANADTITGGGGKDILTGNLGTDTFQYTAITETTVAIGARDVITDFLHLVDKINLVAIDAITGGADNAFVLVGALTGAAGQLAITTSGGNTFVTGDVNGGGADFQIQLTGLVGLTGGDIVL